MPPRRSGHTTPTTIVAFSHLGTPREEEAVFRNPQENLLLAASRPPKRLDRLRGDIAFSKGNDYWRDAQT